MKTAANAEYITFAATLGTANVPLPRAETIRCGGFMKSNPEMIVAWRKFGMSATAIAAQLNRVGMKVSVETVRGYLPKLERTVDKALVDAITAQLRLMFVSSRSSLAQKADHAYIPTLEIPAAPVPSPQPTAAPRVERQATAVSPSPAAVQVKARPDSQVEPAAATVKSPAPAPVPTPTTPEQDAEAALKRSPFYVAPVVELKALPGEEEDMSAVLSKVKTPCSFGEFRRAAWKSYTNKPTNYEIVLPCGTKRLPPKKLLVPLVRGDYPSWKKYLMALEKG
jgi:hypothetical protein